VAPADWLPGEERCTAIGWPPASAPSPWAAYDILEASVTRSGDTPNTAATVLLDNNRATKPSGLTPPSPRDLARTDVFDIATAMANVHKLTIARNPRMPVPPPPPFEIQIHVAPGLSFGRVTGGVVIGGMTEAEHRSWDPSLPLVPGDPRLRPVVADRPGSEDRSLWKVIVMPHGVPSVSIDQVVARAGAELRFYAWPLEGAEGTELPPMLLRGYGATEPDSAPREVFQRLVLRPGEGR